MNAAWALPQRFEPKLELLSAPAFAPSDRRFGSGFDVPMQADLEDHLRRIRVTRPRRKVERAVGGFEPAGVAAQFGKYGGEALLRPVFREAVIHRMQGRRAAERALEELNDFHGVAVF